MDTITLNIESLVGLAVLPIVVVVLTGHIKLAARAIRYRVYEGQEDATPWPLVADLVGMLFAVGSFYAGHLTQVNDALAAGLVGLAAALVTQKGYDALKK